MLGGHLFGGAPEREHPNMVFLLHFPKFYLLIVLFFLDCPFFLFISFLKESKAGMGRILDIIGLKCDVII